ncbi:zinc finger protein [Saccharopolyspora shandongensis]|uniref:zinc finger protein n=1 Tax=Saccharopolyspora shandongensis TaxID=418495 RepID=UPI0033EB88BD
MFRPKHHWQPAEQQRHAVAGTLPTGRRHRDGESVDAFCERTVSTAGHTELDWLWPTCPDCLRAAERLNGIPS